MTDRTKTSIRLGCALALGALFDLIAFRDAFPYADRDWLAPHAGALPFWSLLAFLVACAFALNLTTRPSGTDASAAGAPGSLRETLDAVGVLIPLVILLGLAIAHTAVVTRDVMADQTSHNLCRSSMRFPGSSSACRSSLVR